MDRLGRLAEGNQACTRVRRDRVNTLTKLKELALADRLGGVDTQAKGNKACGLALVNTLTKLEEPAGVGRPGGGNTEANVA